MPTDQRARARRYAEIYLRLSTQWVDELMASKCDDARSAKYERILARMQQIILRGLL